MYIKEGAAQVIQTSRLHGRHGGVSLRRNCEWAAGAAGVSVIADDLDRESLRAAIAQSMVYLAKLVRPIVGDKPADSPRGSYGHTRAFDESLEYWECGSVDRRNQEAVRFFPVIEQFRITIDFFRVLPTGNDGSLAPTPEYKYPIYGNPLDLIVIEEAPQGADRPPEADRAPGRGKLVPTIRARKWIIEERCGGVATRSRGSRIRWIFFSADPGIGNLTVPDGRRLRSVCRTKWLAVSQYWPIAYRRWKDSRGRDVDATARRYLAEHPAERDEIMAYNESYVFFRFVSKGPLGFSKFPLPPGGRSPPICGSSPKAR